MGRSVKVAKNVNKNQSDGRVIAMPPQCKDCLRNKLGVGCIAFSKPYKTGCPSRIVNFELYIKELEDLMIYNKDKNHVMYSELKKEYEHIKFIYDLRSTSEARECYEEDKHRGSGGSKSENGGNRNAKQMMKDNKAPECKDRINYEKEFYNEALEDFESEHGQLEKHKTIGYGMNRSKIDSYTGLEIDKRGIVPSDEDMKQAKEKLLREGKITEEDLKESGL
jgi:hypothetical protein